MSDPATHSDVLVIGGGIGGLTAGLDLARAGLRVRVLEAFMWPGGVVGRHEVDGLTLDAGAESYAVATPYVGELLADLGAADLIEAPNPVGGWVRYDSGQAPLPKGGFLGIPADPLAADVVAILGDDGARRAAQDKELDPQVGWNADGVTTLGALVRARMGDLAVTRLVEPIVGGVHSADPDLLDVDVIAPRLRAAYAQAGSLSGSVLALRGGAKRAGSAVAGVRGGLHVLVDRLRAGIEAAGGEVLCRTQAETLQRVGPSAADVAQPGATGAFNADRGADAAWRVRAVPTPWLPSEPGAAPVDLTARAIVLAVPGAAAGRLVAGLDAATGELLAGAKSCQILLATLVLTAPELDAQPRGTGILVSAAASGVRAKALTHATAKWPDLARRAGPGRHVVRLSYGRDGAGIPDKAEALATALADATELLGVPLAEDRVRAHAMIRWDQAMPRADAEHLERVRALTALCEREGALAAAGAFVAGTGLAAVVHQARQQAAALVAQLT